MTTIKMPGSRCAVATCKNSVYKAKRLSNTHIVFHTFPKDLEIKKKWIQRCRRIGTWNPNSHQICSIHFTNEDYERDLKSELLNLPKKLILKKTAIPSLYLPPNQVEIKPTTSNFKTKRLEERKNVEQIENIKKSPPSNPPQNENVPAHSTQEIMDVDINQLTVETKKIPPLPDHNYVKKCPTGKKRRPSSNTTNQNPEPNTSKADTPLSYSMEFYINTKKEYEDILKKNETLERKNNILLAQIENMNSKVNENKQKLAQLGKEYNDKQNLEETQTKMQEQLEEVLSKNQINLIMKRKQKVLWTTDEISKAFTIRQFSKRCYEYLRKNLNYPIPGLSTLQRYASKINMDQGILPDVLRFMEIASANFSEKDKVVVLQFARMKVESCTENDRYHNKMVGPYNYMYIAQARSLFSKWKQIIYIDFDQPVTEEILYSIINHLENIGYNVVACVSDCEEETTELWKYLEVTINENWIINPKTKDKIFIFLDSQCLLHLMHKFFISTGFNWTEKSITKEPIKQLIKNNLQDKNNKLTSDHLKISDRRSNNARELFSYSTVKALQKIQNNEQNQHIIAFFELINDWYDIFNSSSLNNSPTKSGFGLFLKRQINILHKFAKEILSMHCEDKLKIQNFQECILISINSLILLQKYISKYGETYIYTQKLNLESLESLFTQLRKNNEPPTPLMAISKLKNIIMSKTGELSKKNITEEDANNEEFLVSSVLSKSGVNVKETNLKSPVNKKSIGMGENLSDDEENLDMETD